MARKPMTLAEIRASNPSVDWFKVATTTEKDIRRHQIEDGKDPDAPLAPFRPVPMCGRFGRLQMTQEAFDLSDWRAGGDSAQLGAVPDEHGPGCAVFVAGR